MSNTNVKIWIYQNIHLPSEQRIWDLSEHFLHKWLSNSHEHNDNHNHQTKIISIIIIIITSIIILIQCRRNEIHIGGDMGAAHCIPSHSVHCYIGNILQLDNYWGLQPPSPPVPTGLLLVTVELKNTSVNHAHFAV